MSFLIVFVVVCAVYIMLFSRDGRGCLGRAITLFLMITGLIAIIVIFGLYALLAR